MKIFLVIPFLALNNKPLVNSARFPKRAKDGLLVKRMGEVVDGEYQNYITKGGAYLRQHFWGKYPQLLKLVEHLSDEQLTKLRLGGHDPKKIHAAYAAATKHKGAPTVILARTVKGYGLGEAGEGKNITHSQKKLNDEELRHFRSRFGIYRILGQQGDRSFISYEHQD